MYSLQVESLSSLAQRKASKIHPHYISGNLTTCQGTQLDCAFKIFDDPNHYNESEQQCLAPCNDQIYDSRITLALYPNRAMFAKRPEICNLVRKLLKICQGWVDPHAVGAYGQYGDELKIKKNVLLSAYPNMCKHLCEVFGFDAMVSANLSCNDIRRNLLNAANRYGEKNRRLFLTNRAFLCRTFLLFFCDLQRNKNRVSFELSSAFSENPKVKD